jgi:hypothetical protein
MDYEDQLVSLGRGSTLRPYIQGNCIGFDPNEIFFVSGFQWGNLLRDLVKELGASHEQLDNRIDKRILYLVFQRLIKPPIPINYSTDHNPIWCESDDCQYMEPVLVPIADIIALIREELDK